MEAVTAPMPEPFSVERVDSGYGSLHGMPFPKRSHSSRRNSTISNMPSPTSSSSSTSSHRRVRSSRRPQHRASASYMRCPTSMYRRPTPPSQIALFNFPGFDSHCEPASSSAHLGLSEPPSPTDFITPSLSMPPQTTHYWTSDDTRRQEYAAIDAASRGVKGWVLRKLVPDCLLPKQSKQHVAFDDDTGSVRRYRLDLDDVEEVDSDAPHEKAFKKSVFPWKRRRSCD
ncbi:hypothetical protein TD95_004092 [Thielaviopsis punctulata]|uniref:Uncharacterized protein n=1 Tax=Thielaviopsis punctulata TaxID=72032 RepID=A0A0F4ZBN7_9PEZI|nr:hypothetical protein TD95_004092 [Thielaviopsis punctulata]